jgi:general secretion pathway protein N
MFLPAVYITSHAEEKIGQRYTLADVGGTVWEGSAMVVSKADKNGNQLPFVPGRFSWQLSPMFLLGKVSLKIDNTETLTEPITIEGNWYQWHVNPSGMRLNAEQLSLFGAPFNTLRLSGDVLMSWQELQVTLQEKKMNIIGLAQIDFKKIASALSPIKPLGEYQLTIEWLSQQTKITLNTLEGPLQLHGNGIFQQGRLRFSGVAYADPGKEKQLSLLLNLLGQPLRDGNENQIALEFK